MSNKVQEFLRYLLQLRRLTRGISYFSDTMASSLKLLLGTGNDEPNLEIYGNCMLDLSGILTLSSFGNDVGF